MSSHFDECKDPKDVWVAWAKMYGRLGGQAPSGFQGAYEGLLMIWKALTEQCWRMDMEQRHSMQQLVVAWFEGDSTPIWETVRDIQKAYIEGQKIRLKEMED